MPPKWAHTSTIVAAPAAGAHSMPKNWSWAANASVVDAQKAPAAYEGLAAHSPQLWSGKAASAHTMARRERRRGARRRTLASQAASEEIEVAAVARTCACMHHPFQQISAIVVDEGKSRR